MMAQVPDADSGLAAPTPRKFCDRERRWNPFLRREDSNPVFQAFQRRRTIHTPAAHLRHWRRYLMMQAMFVPTLVLPCVIIAVWLGDYVIGRIALVALGGYGLFFLLSLIWWVMKDPMGGTKKKFPTDSSTLFDMRKGAALRADLWLCGVRASDMLEAQMLEQHSPRNLIIGACIVCPVSFLVFAVEPWGWARFLLWPALVFLYVEICRWMLICGAIEGGSASFAQVAEAYKTLTATDKQGCLERLRVAVAALLMIAVAVGLAVAVGYVVIGLVQWLSHLLGQAILSPVPPMLIATLAVFGAWKLRKNRRRIWMRTCRKYIRNARVLNERFEDFMKDVVANDEVISVGPLLFRKKG
jgi:hypothetical protein